MVTLSSKAYFLALALKTTDFGLGLEIAGLEPIYHAMGCGAQIEGILWDTCTGSDERLHLYYAYWVAKIFRALTNMVLNNLRRFITILSGDQPLCKMFAIVAHPEIVISPSPIEV